MRTTPEGFNLIRSSEGLRLTAYTCPAGRLSIGYGSTHNVTPGMIITEEEAEDRLHQDVAEIENILQLVVKCPLTDNQVSSLVSFVYNVGWGEPDSRDGFRFLKNGKPSTMLRFLNSMNFVDAVGEFEKWSKIHGTQSDGLFRRRLAERELFMRPDGEKSGWLNMANTRKKSNKITS